MNQNLAKLNRAKLIAALRTKLPPEFSWDFSTILEDTNCGTAGCALGLATLVFPESITDDGEPGKINTCEDEKLVDFFGLASVYIFHNIFYDIKFYGKVESGEITPEMVANALEAAQ